MRILILGYSMIVQRRVLTALENIIAISHIDIATRSKSSEVDSSRIKSGIVFDDYHLAIKNTEASIVYISTMNNEHSDLAKEALLQSLHVIVDKPAFVSVDIAKKLVALANSKNLCLAEAVVYEYHPQIEKIKSIFDLKKCKPVSISAVFSFPPLPENNFRYVRKYGGGALLDLGPYAVSPGRIFFNAEPVDVFCKIHTYGGTDSVETSFSILSTYSEGRSMIGYFGFNTQYQNKLNVLGSNVSVDVERVFTNTPDFKSSVSIKSGMDSMNEMVPAADCFAKFLQNVLEGINSKNISEFSAKLLSDAKVMSSLTTSAMNNAKG